MVQDATRALTLVMGQVSLKGMDAHIQDTLEPRRWYSTALDQHARACNNAIQEAVAVTAGKHVHEYVIPYPVISDCAKQLPDCPHQLKSVRGVTEQIAGKYGRVILAVCKQYFPKRKILKILEEISQRKEYLKYMEGRDAYGQIYNSKSEKLDEKIKEVNQLKHDNQSYKATNNKLNADLNAAKEEIKKLKVTVADSVLAENDRLKSQIDHLKKEKKDQEKFIVELTGKLQAKNEIIKH